MKLTQNHVDQRPDLRSSLTMRNARVSFATAALALLIAVPTISPAQGSTTPPTTQSTTPSTPQNPVQDESYRIQAEDVVNIVVEDVAEASGDFLVRKDGKITVPMVGEIDIVGKTTKEITTIVTDKLKKEVKNPRVTVNLKSSSMQRIYVMGAVRASGVLDWKPKWRLTEVIAAAGGLASLPERTKVVLFRTGADSQEISMRKLLVDGDNKANVEVQPGDVVNFQTDVTMRINVVGQVAKPGMTEVLEGQGVAEVLAACGGGTPDARLSGAKLVRKGEEIPVDLYKAVKLGSPSLNISVREGDTLYIPSLISKVSVIGWVGHPGTVMVPDGEELTLTKAVALAGGPISQAKVDSVAVVRQGPDKKPVATKYDLKTLLRGDKAIADPVLQNGDLVVIAQSGKSSMNTANSALGLVGFLFRFFPF